MDLLFDFQEEINDLRRELNLLKKEVPMIQEELKAVETVQNQRVNDLDRNFRREIGIHEKKVIKQNDN